MADYRQGLLPIPGLGGGDALDTAIVAQDTPLGADGQREIVAVGSPVTSAAVAEVLALGDIYAANNWAFDGGLALQEAVTRQATKKRARALGSIGVTADLPAATSPAAEPQPGQRAPGPDGQALLRALEDAKTAEDRAALYAAQQRAWRQARREEEELVTLLCLSL